MDTTTEHQIETTQASQDTRVCDGIICFGGEDWWYHNRGHFDMQIMRELSKSVPVLYINSIGMRVPRPGEGAMFVRRILRKLGSFRRGFVHVRENFCVCSPLSIPGSIGTRVTRKLLPRQIQRYARKMGVAKPLIWIACPPGAETLDALLPTSLVYQRTDRYEEYENVDSQRIGSYDRMLKQRADLTVFCARLLHEQESHQCASSMFADHGVDYDHFADAGSRTSNEPDDVRDIPHPRAGFVGGIDASTFDSELFVHVAKALPEVSFVMVGACSLPEGWCDLPNVHFLGQRDYVRVSSYMSACDVLLMPWNRSEWIRACNPVKLKEYLAVGRPVVSTSFPELDHYEGLVSVADGAEAFTSAIRVALEQPHDPRLQQGRVAHETWQTKAQLIVQKLAKQGILLKGVQD